MKMKHSMSLILAFSMIFASLTVLLPLSLVSVGASDDSDHPYVSDGLVSLYNGTGHTADETVWEDAVGNNDLPINKNNKNFFTEYGLSAEGTKHTFPQGIVDLVNGQAFTVELLFSEFVSLGADYNTFLNSSNDNFALFRRISTNQIEFKFSGNTGDLRPKISDGLDLLQNALISVTYKVGGSCCIYINGVLMAEKPVASAMGANDLFIGHDSSQKKYNTTYRSMRFYNRELSADEIRTNARADGYTVPEPTIPAIETPGYVTVAQPKTNIVGDISLVCPINSADGLQQMLAAEKLPAVAIYSINDKLEVLQQDDTPFSTVADVLTETKFEILSAFYVQDQAAADALLLFLQDIRFYDCFIVSDDPAIIKNFRTKLPTVSGVIDFTSIYHTESALTEAQCLDIRRSIKENNGTIAILPAHLCTTETVQYLYGRQVNVWAQIDDGSTGPTKVECYNALLSGAIGVVSNDTATLLEIACNELPASTMTRMTLNVGHRGIPSLAPENTLEGAILAYESGANVIELDIYLTKDGEIVIMHDGTTGRTCDKDLSVEGSTLAQLKELFVNKGYENNDTYKTCRIPTLKEYLEYFKGKDCNLYIEIKSTNGAIVKACKTLVDEYEMYGQCTVITFHESILAVMRKDWPEMHGGFLCGDIMSDTTSEAGFRNAMSVIGKYNASINPSMSGYEEEDIRVALRRGISVYPWTFRGNLETYKNHFLWGYSGLTGDNADVLGNLTHKISYTGATEFKVGDTLTPTLAVENYLRETADKDVTSLQVLVGQDLVSLNDNSLTFTGAGEVTILLSYRHSFNRRSFYDLCTQPITLTVVAPETESESVSETEAETDTPAESVSDTETLTGTETESTTGESGCASSLIASAGIAMTASLLGIALVLSKRKQEND